ncbi:MAG: hypothetical protein Q4B29_00155 [Candidatus Saccharibacteria bacterium]|nr:hypothetical protein [Candidatus Saccharibacteria bacterium]
MEKASAKLCKSRNTAKVRPGGASSVPSSRADFGSIRGRNRSRRPCQTFASAPTS